eukprot:jgi/Ulvmu1/10330/UM061_0013.1
MVGNEDQVKICVIDVRLGKREENPEEQLLGSWSYRPQTESAIMDIARLARGSIGFCSHFQTAPKSSSVSSVTFDQHTMAMLETEPSILWILYAPNCCLTLPMCPDRATSCLRSIDNLFRIMHQSVATMITSQGYIAARNALKSFLFKFMPGFCKRDGWCTLHDMYSPMSPHRGLPFIPLKDPCFQGLQAFISSLAATSALPSRATRGCMATYKETLLHSTLSASDTTALYLFLSRNTIPVIRTENKTTKTLQKLYTGVTEWKRDDANVLDPAAWVAATTAEHQGFVLCESAGSAVEQGPGPSSAGCPVLYLEDGSPCRLVVWQTQGFQVVLLMAGEQQIHAAELPAVRHHMLRAVAELDRSLAPALPFPRSGFIGTLAAEIRMHEKGHVQGHRYALVDGATAAAACAGTPLSKLQTATSTTCQAALALAWQDCQRQLVIERARRRREAAADSAQRAWPSGSAAGAEGADAAPSGSAAEGADASPSGGATGGPSPGDESTEGSQGCGETAAGGANAAADAAGGQAADGGGEGRSEPAVRMEVLAQAPNKKWIAARWALGGELVHIDDVATRDRNSLASADRNVQGMLSTYFPGVMGL